MDAAHRRSRRGVPLNADPADQLRLLDLQALDLKLDQLAHKRKTLPELAELEKLAAEHSRLRDAEVTTTTEVNDLERERKRAESDVAQVRQRRDRDQKRLDAGQVSAAKELSSLQSEIASLDRRQADLEEIELELMEKLEEAQQQAARLTSEREDVGRRAVALQKTRDETWGQIDADAADARKQRDELSGQLPDDLLGLYEKTRKTGHGIGAAALRKGRCEGCHLQLDPVTLNKFRGTAPETVIRCEECRRILVRTEESGL